MYLGDLLNDDYIAAQKKRDIVTVSALRQIRAALHNAEIAARGQLDEAATIKFLQQQLKQRLEAAEVYRTAGRAEQLVQEESEATVIRSYLPLALPEAELMEIVQVAVTEAGSKGFGAAMQIAVAKVAGRATGQEVAAAIKKVMGQP